MTTNQSSSKISYLFVAVISAMLILSVLALYWAIQTYESNWGSSLVNIMLSVSGIALAFYVLAQVRRRPMKLGFEQQKVFTSIRCTSCEYESTKEFEKGDYVLKETGNCPKCNSTTVINSIYKEATQKEKEED